MNIPQEILAPIISTKWQCDEYALNKFKLQLNNHEEMDLKTGYTAKYNHANGNNELTLKEFQAMQPFIPEELTHGDWINQHYQHSLEQFYAEIQKAWNKHTSQTNFLIGTPSGRIS